MDERWLDSLSEDWNSQPRHSSPTTPSSTANAANAPRSRQSSIQLQEAPKRKRLISNHSSRIALLQCTNSDVNISSHTSQTKSPGKPTKRGHRSNTSSLSSSGKEFQFDSVVRKSRSSSPPKSKTSTTTPDWKRLLSKGNGTYARKDLFSPNRLEGLFRTRAPSPAEVTTSGNIFPIFKALQEVPSSPPQWPTEHFQHPPQSSLNDLEATIAECSSEALPNIDGGRTEGMNRSDTEQQDTLRRRKQSRDVPPDPKCYEEGSSRLTNATDPRSIIASDLNSKHESSHKINPVSNESVLPPRFHVVTKSTSASSAIGDFSPVFVTKHKTAAGLVDYSAVDLSDPQVQEQLKNSNIWSFPGSGVPMRPERTLSETVTVGDQPPSIVTSGRSPTDQDHSIVSIPGASPAYDTPDSPLSSSILPSDSVSQVHCHIQSTIPQPQLISSNSSQHARPKTPPATMLPISHELKAKPPKSPLKLFGNHDTYTNSRLHNRMVQLHVSTSRKPPNPPDSMEALSEIRNASVVHQSSVSIETTIPCGDAIHEAHPEEHWLNDETRSGALNFLDAPDTDVECLTDEVTKYMDGATPDQDVAQTKRCAPEVFKQSTPKRRRTFGHQEAVVLTEQVQIDLQEQHQRLRQFADLGSDPAIEISVQFNPLTSNSTFARPRNPTPAQARHVASDASWSLNTHSTTRQEHIAKTEVSIHSRESDKVKLIAPEVAKFCLKKPYLISGSIRKPSVSTQDYLDEATKIMDLIRSKRPLTSDLGLLEIPSSEEVDQDIPEREDVSILTVSRPPSREGVIKAWRKPHEDASDPVVQNYLQQYQEIGDESFMASTLHEYADNDLVEDGLSDLDDDLQSMHIRIVDPLRTRQEQELMAVSNDTTDSPVKTTSSNQSTDSTGRTIGTQSSGRTRTLPVIAPGKVHHLISSIEYAAGMRYDSENQIWIRDKTASAKDERFRDRSSSAGTEDPFSSIPDLTVHDSQAGNPSQLTDGDQASRKMVNSDLPSNSPYSAIDQFHLARHNDSTRSEARGENLSEQEPGLTRLQRHALHNDDSPEHIGWHSAGSVHNKNNPSLEQSAELIEEELERREIVVPSSDKISPVPTGSVRSRRREVSVFFSSPPVSREWAAQQFNSDDAGSPSQQRQLRLVGETSSPSYSNGEVSSVDWPASNRGASNQARKRSARQASQSFTLSRIDEYHEISVVGTRPDGRCVSLTLGVSTPLPAHRHAAVTVIPQNIGGYGAALHSLSPLSEFTLHQDDRDHMNDRGLQDDLQIVGPTRGIQSAAVVQELIQALTDAESDEPYWDSMRILVLKDRQLKNVHALDKLCPSLEDLNLSRNCLAHLGGVPGRVRHLDLSNNSLSALTSWSHLMYLQYLDISNNQLDTLEGLGNLLQLRELRADHNKLSTIESVFDLDGLLSLSVKGNNIGQLDLRSADLRRLTKLNVSENKIVAIEGLDCLPALVEIDICHNNLMEISSIATSTRTAKNIISMCVSHNRLRVLDLAIVPGLRHLEADSNCLSLIDSIPHRLEHISMRDQTPVLSPAVTELHMDPYQESHHLFLSGSGLSAVKMTVPFLNLRTLDLSFTGLQSLPENFDTLAPNIRILNLNYNALKHLKPLRRIVKLQRLFVAGNRLSRLRKTIRDVAHHRELEELDLRDNSFSASFYLPARRDPLEQRGLDAFSGVSKCDQSNNDLHRQLRYLLGPTDPEKDIQHILRLDEDSQLRRRVYELLLAAKCGARLKHVDGLDWSERRRKVLDQRDGMWERLKTLGVIVDVAGQVVEGQNLRDESRTRKA